MDVPKIHLRSNLFHYGRLTLKDFYIIDMTSDQTAEVGLLTMLSFQNIFDTSEKPSDFNFNLLCVRTYFVSCTYFSGSLHYSVLPQISGNHLILCQSWSVPCCVASLLSSTDIWTFSSILGKVLSWVHPHWTQTATALPGLCLHEPVKVTCEINYFLYYTRFAGN